MWEVPGVQACLRNGFEVSVEAIWTRNRRFDKHG
jgi:hypothetical protein